VRVAEDSLFAYAEPCEAARTTAMLQARPVDEPWLSASVTFCGPFEGSVRVSLPRALAADLGGAFSGLPPTALDDPQLADFAGELANMVCGRWLTLTHRAERFELAAPVVAGAVAGTVAATFEPGAIGVALNDSPLLIALSAGSPVAQA
jgi:CheY-specific phosphatase CheX